MALTDQEKSSITRMVFAEVEKQMKSTGMKLNEAAATPVTDAAKADETAFVESMKAIGLSEAAAKAAFAGRPDASSRGC